MWICIFQTLNPFFCYLGVFAQNVPFIKKNNFSKRNFLRPILTCLNPPNRFFAISGCLRKMFLFYKEEFFLQEDFFETNLDLSRHPQQVFWIFFSCTKYLFSIFVFIWVIGKFRELCAKFWNFWVNIHGEIICQSRLLLNPFYSGPIVHCSSRGNFWLFHNKF